MTDWDLKLTERVAKLRAYAEHFLAHDAASYAWSAALVAVAFFLRSALAPTLGNQALYLFLVPPVLVAGVLGGWGPGLLATMLSLIIHLYATGEGSNLIHPSEPLSAAEFPRQPPFLPLAIPPPCSPKRL